MRYTKVVDLWDHNTAYMVRTGQLKLQAGKFRIVGLLSPHILKTETHARGLNLFAKFT